MLKNVEKRYDKEGRELRTDAMGREYAVIHDLLGTEYHEYTVDSLPEPKKTKQEIRLDDGLFENEEERIKNYGKWTKEEEEELLGDFSEEYYQSSWNDTPAAATDEKNIDRLSFYNKDFKEQQYYIYKQLVDITSLLSDIKEVLTDGTKKR